MKEIVTKYFRKGFRYKEILQFLEHHHGIKISLRTLQNKLKSYGLQKRNRYDDEDISNVLADVNDHISRFGNTHGYRDIWHNLRLSGSTASRDLVMVALRELDPEGAISRKARKLKRRNYHSTGPNDVWHIDGYDKLKPFGFPVHGCIDGFSRKIIWLSYVKSNNDPYTVGKLYLKAVEDANIVPRRVRTDCGSENIFFAASQCFLRRNHTDVHAGDMAHLYGSSHHNQRIEAWWSQFRRMKTEFIINLFRDMINCGQYNSDDLLERACVRFCFGNLIQSELDHCVEAWNSHYIRKSVHSECYGRPEHLYYFPPGTFCNQAVSVDENDMQIITDHLDEYHHCEDEDNIFDEYFEYLSSELNIENANNFVHARDNYLSLLDHAR